MKNIAEFFHLSKDWSIWRISVTRRMRVHYYCVMDIPNHPLRVKGLEYLQQRERKDDRKEAKMEVCTCPKCGIQLYRPSGTVSLQCTCGYVFSVKVWCVCFELFSVHNCVHSHHR